MKLKLFNEFAATVPNLDEFIKVEIGSPLIREELSKIPKERKHLPHIILLQYEPFNYESDKKLVTVKIETISELIGVDNTRRRRWFRCPHCQEKKRVIYLAKNPWFYPEKSRVGCYSCVKYGVQHPPIRQQLELYLNLKDEVASPSS